MPGKTRMPVTRDAKTCLSCGGTSSQMFACGRCYLATYCSQRCSDRDWSNHRDDCKFVTWHSKHVGSNFCHSCFVHACPHASSKLKRCGGCLRVSYCSRECQENDWEAHVAVCTRDKNRKASEARRNEMWLREILEEQAAEEEARAKQEEEDLERGIIKEKKSPYEGIPDLYDFEDSPFTKEQRLRIELQTRQQRELLEKLEKKKREYEAQQQVETAEGSDTELWEKKYTQIKRIPNIPTRGKPVSHTIQETQYCIRISNKPPKMHEGYVKNADNTNSYEEEIREQQKDGSIVYKKSITTNGVIENDKQLEEIMRQLGDDYTYKQGVQLGEHDSDN